MNVADLMIKTPITVRPETTLVDAARIMLAQRVSGLPVLDAQARLVGVITEGDLLRRPELGTEPGMRSWLRAFFAPGSVAAEYATTHGRRVSEIMTPEPLSISPDTPLVDAASLMRNKRLKRLPVVEGDKLVGILSRTDLLRTLVGKLLDTTTETPDAAGIRAHIEATLKKESWAPKAGIHVAVSSDGIVELEGTVFSEAERRAVCVVAENAPGVREVHDHLIYVEPNSGMAFPAA